MTGTYRRRELLGTLGGIVLTTGCVGTSNDSDTASATDGAIRGVRVDGLQLVVELASDASVTTVNVIAPDGSTFASRDVATGATRVEAEVGVQYEPGMYRIVAASEADTIDEETISLVPDLRIEQFGVGANYSERIPSELPFAEAQALVQVSNEGVGPTGIDKLLVTGDVPNPTTDLGDSEESGIFDEEDGVGDIDRLIIPPGEGVTFFSTSDPFLVTRDGVTCEPESQSGTARVGLARTVPESRLEATFSIRYSGAEEVDQCEITVTGREDA